MRHFLCVPYIESANVEKGTTYCILLCTKLLIPVLVYYVLLVYCTGTYLSTSLLPYQLAVLYNDAQRAVTKRPNRFEMRYYVAKDGLRVIEDAAERVAH